MTKDTTRTLPGGRTAPSLRADLSTAFGLNNALLKIGASASEASALAGAWTGPPASGVAELMQALEAYRRSRPIATR